MTPCAQPHDRRAQQVAEPVRRLPERPGGSCPPLGPANHGNGFLATGLLDTDSKSPFPNKASITFTTPGTYVYYCNIHQPDMKGTIVVQ